MHQKKNKQNKTKTKKKQKKPQKNQQVSAAKKWVFDASQRVNKSRSSTFHNMMLLFHKYWDFFLSYQHISNFGIVRMWECVVRSIRDTNDSISQCKSLYIWNSLFCSRLDCSCLSRPIQVGINFWNFQPLVRSVPISWPWATYFSFQPSYSVNKYILYYFGSIVGWSVLFVVVKSCIPFRSK